MTYIAIAIACFIKGLILSKWERFKDREALKPITLTARNGVFVQNGPVQKWCKLFDWLLALWVMYMAGIVIYGLLTH